MPAPSLPIFRTLLSTPANPLDSTDMKKFLVFLILLGVVAGGLYYYNPALLGLDAPAGKVAKKKGKKKKKAPKAKPETQVGEAAAAVAVSAGPAEEEVEEEVVDGPPPSPLDFPDNLEARAKAKAEDRPSLILWYGSDWMADAAKLVKEWNKLEKKNLPLVLGQIDERVGTVPELNAREKLLPIGAFMNLPVAVLMAPDETLLGIYTGKTVKSAAAMEKAVSRTLARMPEYMKLVEKARSAEGLEGARAAADALAMQPYEVASRNRQLKDILNRKDPKHETVNRYLFCMDHMGMFDEINAVLRGGKGADAKFDGKERQFADAARFVQRVLKSRKLNTELEQRWLSGLAYVYREQYKATNEPALRKKLVDTYRKVVAVDARSEYGKGAQRWANYWDESFPYVFEEPYYDSGEMTVGFEKEWRVNVSKSMKGPGSYTFSLVPCSSKNGRMTSRSFKLYANGKHVSDAQEPADKDTKTATFSVPRALKGRVEVRFQVQCYDGWFGCAGEMKMEKK